MIASLLFGLDSEVCGFKDQNLASETLPTATNVYSRWLRSSFGQNTTSTIPNTSPSESFACSCSSCGGCVFRGTSHGGGRAS